MLHIGQTTSLWPCWYRVPDWQWQVWSTRFESHMPPDFFRHFFIFLIKTSSSVSVMVLCIFSCMCCVCCLFSVRYRCTNKSPLGKKSRSRAHQCHCVYTALECLRAELSVYPLTSEKLTVEFLSGYNVTGIRSQLAI